jgi:hypothetical protein
MQATHTDDFVSTTHTDDFVNATTAHDFVIMSLQGEAKVDKLFKFIEKLKELLQNHVAFVVVISVLLLVIIVGSVLLTYQSKKYINRRNPEDKCQLKI